MTETADGTFQRQASTFRDWVGRDDSVEAGRYHLYVSLGLPLGAPRR